MSADGVNVFAQGDESRAVLADHAARAARRNQPRFLLVGAGGLLVASLAWAALAWWGRSVAAEALYREQVTTLVLRGKLDEYEAELKAQADTLGEKGLQPDPTLQSRIEQIGRECGLANLAVAVADDPRAASKDLIRKRYSHTFQAQETAAILCWVQRVTHEVDGVELADMTIEPALATVDGKARWKGTVAFSRWQRKTTN